MTDPMIESFERWHMATHGPGHLHSSRDAASKAGRGEIWRAAWREAVAAQTPPAVSTDSGSPVSDKERWHDESKWHAPGLGEVHSADHSQMIYCEADADGEERQIISDSLAREVCDALNSDDTALLRQALDALESTWFPSEWPDGWSNNVTEAIAALKARLA